ncbi:hypothetical protein TcWFU_008854 [Taenia crassiceps]|uniref:Uncharacterized protein n=1 Tax=Taenia crassiceps TaxID=6207 RepID=A0ABR4QBG1_9CEST
MQLPGGQDTLSSALVHEWRESGDQRRRLFIPECGSASAFTAAAAAADGGGGRLQFFFYVGSIDILTGDSQIERPFVGKSAGCDLSLPVAARQFDWLWRLGRRSCASSAHPLVKAHVSKQTNAPFGSSLIEATVVTERKVPPIQDSALPCIREESEELFNVCCTTWTMAMQRRVEEHTMWKERNENRVEKKRNAKWK